MLYRSFSRRICPVAAGPVAAVRESRRICLSIPHAPLACRAPCRNSTGAARVMLLDTLHPTDDGWWAIGDPEGVPSTGPEVTP
jgi:hypothetical protein